jgi:hypothetical protein
MCNAMSREVYTSVAVPIGFVGNVTQALRNCCAIFLLALMCTHIIHCLTAFKYLHSRTWPVTVLLYYNDELTTGSTTLKQGN